MVEPILSAEDLRALRDDAESMMQDELLFRRLTGRTVPNPVTWLEEPEYADLFTTKGSVGGPGGDGDPAPRTVVIGGVERVVIQGGVKVPVTAAEVRDGDEAVVLKVGPISDPTLLGKVFRVVGFGGKSWATQRRLDVVEL